jgi:hypothetical protein
MAEPSVALIAALDSLTVRSRFSAKRSRNMCKQRTSPSRLLQKQGKNNDWCAKPAVKEPNAQATGAIDSLPSIRLVMLRIMECLALPPYPSPLDILDKSFIS